MRMSHVILGLVSSRYGFISEDNRHATAICGNLQGVSPRRQELCDPVEIGRRFLQRRTHWCPYCTRSRGKIILVSREKIRSHSKMSVNKLLIQLLFHWSQQRSSEPL